MKVKRGEIYFALLNDDVVGSEQSGERPVLILQNDIGNKYSPTTIVSSITSKDKKQGFITHLDIDLELKSTVMLEQINTIDKSRLVTKIGELSDEEMLQINEKIKISLGLS